MKFTKEQAVEELTAKISAKDKDLDLGRTIAECVENTFKIVGENEELELSKFVAMVQPFISTAAGLGHKNAATATKTLQDKIVELESQAKNINNIKESGKAGNEEVSKEMQSLLERLERLEKDKAENEKAIRIASKRKDIANGIKKLGVDDSDWISTLLDEVSISEDTDVEKKAKDYVALYNKTHTSQGSPTPKATGGTNSEKIDLSGLDSALSQIRGQFGQK